MQELKTLIILIKTKILILIVISLSSCGMDNEEINKGWWKHNHGHSIGCCFNFSEVPLYNDTIYNKNMPEAIIIKSSKGYFGESNKIYIKDLASDKVGVYSQKGI